MTVMSEVHAMAIATVPPLVTVPLAFPFVTTHFWLGPVGFVMVIA